jgi:hypothetical protein
VANFYLRSYTKNKTSATEENVHYPNYARTLHSYVLLLVMAVAKQGNRLPKSNYFWSAAPLTGRLSPPFSHRTNFRFLPLPPPTSNPPPVTRMSASKIGQRSFPRESRRQAARPRNPCGRGGYTTRCATGNRLLPWQISLQRGWLWG